MICIIFQKCSFVKEGVLDTILFAAYIVVMGIIYLIFCFGLLRNIIKEMWETKSILGILSPDIVMEIPELKNFVVQNSSLFTVSNSIHK